MRGRVVFVAGALSVGLACGRDFASEGVPVPEDAGPIEAATPNDASVVADAEAGAPCDQAPVTPMITFTTDILPTRVRTDGAYVYWLDDHRIDRAPIGGNTIEHFEAQATIEEIAATTDALFYLSSQHILQRPRNAFAGVGLCAGCDLGAGYTGVFGNGIGTSVVVGSVGGDVYLFTPNNPVRPLLAQLLAVTHAAAASSFAVMVGTFKDASGISVVTSPDAGPIALEPLQVATDGITIFASQVNGDIVTIDRASGASHVLATKQPTPIGDLILTSTHLWFATPSGIRRVRVGDGCVQTVTTSVALDYAVAGSKLFAVDGTNVLSADVPE